MGSPFGGSPLDFSFSIKTYETNELESKWTHNNRPLSPNYWTRKFICLTSQILTFKEVHLDCSQMNLVCSRLDVCNVVWTTPHPAYFVARNTMHTTTI